MVHAFERENLMVRMQGFMSLSPRAVYVCAALLLLGFYLLLLPRAHESVTEISASTAAPLQHQAMNFPPQPDTVYDPN